MQRQRFRYSSAITVAAIIVMISGFSLGRWAPYLLPLLVLPLALAVWTWRAGTDADAEGLTVRSAVASRRLPWPSVSGLVTDARGRVSAQLTSGRAIELPAVGRADLPRLVAASGQQLLATPQEGAPQQSTPQESGLQESAPQEATRQEQEIQ